MDEAGADEGSHAERPVTPPPADPLADGLSHPLDPRSVDLAQAQGLVAAFAAAASLLPAPLISLAALGARSLATAAIAASWLAITALALAFAVKWPAYSHRYASYTLDPLGIEIRRGVVWRVVISVPRSRVQHTDVTQGPLERRYGLGRLVIYTAGSTHAQVALHGLDHRRALEIRDVLLPREGGDAV